MGFEYLVFSRAPYKLKQSLRESNSLEFIWQVSDYKEDAIFTHLTYDMYWSPEGFEFDDYFNDEQIIDDKRFTSYNLERRLESFAE